MPQGPLSLSNPDIASSSKPGVSDVPPRVDVGATTELAERRDQRRLLGGMAGTFSRWVSILGASTGASDLGDQRAFLQRRVLTYLKTQLFFLTAFYLWGIVACFASHGMSYMVENRSNLQELQHPALIAGLFSVLVYLRSGERSQRILEVLEGGTTVFMAVMLAVMAQALPVGPGPERSMILAQLVLGLALTLVMRSAIVPSTARRTVAISGLSSLALGVSFAYMAAWDRVGEFAPSPLSMVVVWGITFTVATTILSRVVYGLHQRVRAAMELGQYTLLDKIGEGGMGVVYRASHAMLRRPTAIKLLLPGRSTERDLARFEREVQLTARLTHPNTVTIYDYGRTPDGVFYYAMEYLDGATLEAIVETDGPQRPERVVHILSQVSGALAEAHGIGLIHRDIKPANILLTNQGGSPDVAKVVDFGLVKDVEQAQDGSLTRSEGITGTPLYMAPEAIKHDQVDARSDIYALGAVGYYLLTGQHVFSGRTLIDVLSKHLYANAEPVSERLGQSVPSDLEAIIMACLDKNPAKRPASARELRERLVACQTGLWDEHTALEWWEERREALVMRQTELSQSGERAKDGATLAVDVLARSAS